MDLDDGAVEGQPLQFDPQALCAWQVGKDSVEVPLLGPPSQPGVDGVPLTEPWRSAPPRAAVLGDRQDGLEHVQVRQAASAALSRETRRKEGVLGFGEFHP